MPLVRLRHLTASQPQRDSKFVSEGQTRRPSVRAEKQRRAPSSSPGWGSDVSAVESNKSTKSGRDVPAAAAFKNLRHLSFDLFTFRELFKSLTMTWSLLLKEQFTQKWRLSHYLLKQKTEKNKMVRSRNVLIFGWTAPLRMFDDNWNKAGFYERMTIDWNNFISPACSGSTMLDKTRKPLKRPSEGPEEEGWVSLRIASLKAHPGHGLSKWRFLKTLHLWSKRPLQF